VQNRREWLLALLLMIPGGPLIRSARSSSKFTSPGPALYTQIRLGRHGAAFRMRKIRTMSHSEAGAGPVGHAWRSARHAFRPFLRDTHLASCRSSGTC